MAHQRYQLTRAVLILTVTLIGCEQQKTPSPSPASPPIEVTGNSYVFERGFPLGNTTPKAYDDNDLNRAIEAYKFFYPTVSGSRNLRRQREGRHRAKQGLGARSSASRNTSASPLTPILPMRPA